MMYLVFAGIAFVFLCLITYIDQAKSKATQTQEYHIEKIEVE